MHRRLARTLAVASALGAFFGAPARSEGQAVSCGVSAVETRWLSESYRETHTYGLGNDQWIDSYGGLAAAGDSVFLYDHVRPRIAHLSGELEERHAFGRKGEGPGEFNLSWPIRWLDDISEGYVDFDGRHLVVYDRLDLAVFDAAGNFQWSVRRPSPRAVTGIRFVSAAGNEEVVFGVDSLDSTGRRLQLWRVRRSDRNHELLWEQAVPHGASDGNFASLGNRGARSYWAGHRDCVIVTDGGRPFLWVVDLSTLQTDSIALPAWQVPTHGALPSDTHMLNFGGREVEPPPPPALLSRWTGLIVDPDGHAWLKAWTESPEEIQVFVVSLVSAEPRSSSPPAFPTAFGPPGVFYTARAHPETDEHHLVRFEGVRRRR